MTAKTKHTLKLLFGNLVNNNIAIEGAKTLPWWVAAIMFVIGSFLPVIPIMVNASKTKGQDFVSSYTYSYDQGLVTCGVELKNEDLYKFEVKEGQLIGSHRENITDEFVAMTRTWDGDKDLTPVASFTRTFEGKSERCLNVYYTDRPVSGKTNSVNSMINTISAQKYVLGTEDIYSAEAYPDVDAKKGVYIPSYIILYKTGLYSTIYKTGTTSAAKSTYAGLDWKNVKFENLLDEVTTVEGKEININDRTYVEGAFAKWKGVFNAAYVNQRVKTFWMNSGLYYGIYLVLGVFMGLMMFLLTRGKANPNRGLTFWITTKISWIACVAPAILAMAVGFFWSMAAGLGFIVLFGLRIMWLSMRSLSPTQQA